jgi:aminoacrylate hydrolase
MEPVLLITGLGGKASFWSRQVAALAPRFAPLTYDLRARTSVEALARDALELMDQRGVERCHVVGHSTGGAIAQVIAAEHPGRVRRLVLSATWSAPTAPFRALFELRRRILRDLGVQAYATLGALTAWPDDWLERHPELLRAGADPDDAQGLLARIEAILAFDGAARLSAIRAPTLVVCAQDDRVVPLGHSKRIAAAIAGAELQVLPYGGHFPQVAASDAYNGLLKQFLEKA